MTSPAENDILTEIKWNALRAVADGQYSSKVTRHTNDFSEIMGFIRLFGTTYLKKGHAK